MPNECAPAKYSPESLITTRRYTGTPLLRSLSLARAAASSPTKPEELFRRLFLAAGRRDLGCEIRFLLVDSLAQSIAHKSGNLHRRADLALSFLQRLGDRLGVSVDEGLLEQADFLVIGLQTGLDDLFDHVLGLALLAVFVGEHVLLTLYDGGIEPGRIQRLRIGGRNMHGDLTPEHGEFVGLAGGFQRHDHAHLACALDHGIVHIARHHALADFE